MIVIRRSYLEEFRKVCATDYDNEAELIASIQGQDEPNWMMEAGIAWHAALQGLAPDEVDEHGVCTYTGWRFQPQDIEAARLRIGQGAWEIPGVKRFDCLGQQVLITGQADHLCGLVCSDVKTKFSPLDVRHYDHSLQWRVYLCLHDCQCFRYVFCEMHESNRDLMLKNIATCRYWPYPGMEADVQGWVTRFVAWAKDRQLLNALTPEAPC